MMVPWLWPPPIPASTAAIGTDDVTNQSGVTGATATDALNTLQTEITTIDATIAGLGTTSIANQSLVSGATATAALNQLLGDVTFTSSFVAPPATPNAADFNAATATDPDLANNGFLVHLQNSPWTTFTRAGDVDMFNTTPPAANTYRSTLMGGLLYCQFPIGVSVVITKQVNIASAGVTVKTHAWLTRLFDASNATAGLLLTWYIAGLANPAGAAKYGDAGTQIVYAGILNQHWELTSWVVGNAPIGIQNVNVGTDFGGVVNYLRLSQASGTSNAYAVRAGTPTSFLMPAAPSNNTMTLPAQRAGLIVNNGTAQFVVIDFIRQQPDTQFP